MRSWFRSTEACGTAEGARSSSTTWQKSSRSETETGTSELPLCCRELCSVGVARASPEKSPGVLPVVPLDSTQSLLIPVVLFSIKHSSFELNYLNKDGVISAWRGGSDSRSPFELIASLRGHTRAMVSLTVRGKRLYSGSMDHTIKVWDLDTLQCIMILNEHTGVVTSLICWDQFLLSSSLDCTGKVWAATEEGPLEVIYTHKEENSILALGGMTDAEEKPILFCSCYDNSVHLYELPSFLERGRLFAKQEVRTIEIGPKGRFFTGDGTSFVDSLEMVGGAQSCSRIFIEILYFLQQPCI